MHGEHLLTQTAIVTDRSEQRGGDGNIVRDEFGNVQLLATTRTARFWYRQLGADEAPPVAEQTGNGYLPPDDPIGPTSIITIDGVAHQVIGPPFRPVNPRNGERGLVRVALKRTTG